MTDKMSMSLDEIVKASRAGNKREKPVGGKAKGDKPKERAAPYKQRNDKSNKEKPAKAAPKEAEPSPVVFVGNLPFVLEAAALGKQYNLTDSSIPRDRPRRKLI